MVVVVVVVVVATRIGAIWCTVSTNSVRQMNVYISIRFVYTGAVVWSAVGMRMSSGGSGRRRWAGGTATVAGDNLLCFKMKQS